MNKTKKLAIYVSLASVALVIILLVSNIFNNNSYRTQIPVLVDLTTLSTPVKDQLTMAHKKAYDSPTTDNIGMLGMAYHSCAYYDQAEQCYKLAIKSDKSKWEWSYYLGYLYQEMSNSKAAIENFNFVIKENPNALTVWYYLGKAYQDLAEEDKAEAAFNKIAYLQDDISKVRSVRINYFSLPISAKFELSRIYLNTKRLDEAEKILQDVIQRNHTIGPIYRLLGNVYSAKGDSVLSKTFTVRAQDLADVTSINDTLIDKLALISRSEMYLPKQIDDALNSANPEWALQLFNHALLYLPDNKYLISKAIKYFLRMNNGKEVLPYLNKNFNDFNDNFNEMKNIADLLFMNGFYSQAIPYYSQAKKLNPEFHEQLVNFAWCYWKLDKKDSALTLISEQYEKYKNNPIVLCAEVDFMLKIGENAKAKSNLIKFRQIAPSNPRMYKLSGMVAELEGNPDAAIQMYEAAFKGDPTDLETVQKLVNILIKQKLWSKAIAQARNSLKYHPNSYYLLEKLGTMLLSCPDPNLRNIQEGIELSGRAFFHIASDSPTLLSAGKNLAGGYAMMGNFEAANYYMSITLNMAQSENVSKEYKQGLLNLSNKIKQLSNKQ